MTAADVRASMRYTTTVPLFDSGAEAAEHGMRDIEEPSEEASRVIEKIVNRRSDVNYG